MSDPPAPQPSPRQTQHYLKGLLAGRGLDPKSKLGQNFLIDLNLIDLVIREGELSSTDLVLEVGSGTGSLTARLADEVGQLVSVELDAEFHQLAREHVEGRENVTLIRGDILRTKNALNPEVMSTLDEKKASGLTSLKLIANLPYVVATPVIGNLLLERDDVELMVVTVQWEIAEKLAAEVGTKEYGSLAVFVQSLAEVRVVRRLAPSVFWPRPAVDSGIVHIAPSPEKRAVVGDVGKFRNFLRDLYVHKRKNLRQALAGSPQGRRDKSEVDAKLAELGMDGSVRAETLTIDEHLRLCAAFG